MADWLEDPLMVHEIGSSTFKQSKSLSEDEWRKWKSFHFSTRLKLEAADHFCRLALGAASMPHDCGLPLLARSQTKWYLDAFFFELMSAYDTLLHEMNVIYAINLDIESVKWSSMRDKLPNPLVDLMESEWEAVWFRKVRWYRNRATHHMRIPTGAGRGGLGETPWDYDSHEVTLWYFDTDTNEWKREDINEACPDYLKKMIKHIHAVWIKMAEEFD